MTTTTRTSGPGVRLAERLGITIIGTEGHDLRAGCIACDSSDAARIHEDTGVYFCYSCHKALSAWDLCKVVLQDHDAAKRLMVDLGLFEDRPPTSNGNGKSSPVGDKQPSDDEIIDQAARNKGTTGNGFRAIGAIVKNGVVVFPTFRLDGETGERISYFYINPKDPADKGKNAQGKPAGCFLPVVRPTEGEKSRVVNPRPGEAWIICEGGKNAAAYATLDYKAVGLNGKHVKREFLPGFVAALKDVDVVLMPDGDIQSVEAFKKLGAALHGTARSVRLGSLPYEDTLRDTGGDDVRDVLKQRGTEGPEVVNAAIAAAKPLGKDGEVEEPAEPPRFVEVFSCPEFLALDLKTRFLVRNVLAAGQPAVMGGRSKTLKTSIAIDLAVSLGSGTPFLGQFDAELCNVGLWSGESGAAVVRETAKRQAAARGVDLAGCNIDWGFSLPKLSVGDHLAAMAELIDKRKLKVIIVDPLYLCLLDAQTAGQAGNVFAMGAVLEPLTAMGQATGATIILLHHFRKSGLVDDQEPAGLEELSMSGVAEWARQWILFQRRSAYQADGHHELWMRTGGSAGHAGLWALDVDEGTLDPDTFEGRKWDVEVKPVSDARQEAKAARETRKAADMERREGEHVERVLEALRRFPAGETTRAIKTAARLNTDNTDRALFSLEKDGRIVPCEVQKGGNKYAGYRLKT